MPPFTPINSPSKGYDMRTPVLNIHSNSKRPLSCPEDDGGSYCQSEVKKAKRTQRTEPPPTLRSRLLHASEALLPAESAVLQSAQSQCHSPLMEVERLYGPYGVAKARHDREDAEIEDEHEVEKHIISESHRSMIPEQATSTTNTIADNCSKTAAFLLVCSNVQSHAHPETESHAVQRVYQILPQGCRERCMGKRSGGINRVKLFTVAADYIRSLEAELLSLDPSLGMNYLSPGELENHSDEEDGYAADREME